MLSESFEVRRPGQDRGLWSTAKVSSEQNESVVNEMLSDIADDVQLYFLAASFECRVLVGMMARNSLVSTPTGVVLLGYPFYRSSKTRDVDERLHEFTSLAEQQGKTRVFLISGKMDDSICPPPHSIGHEMLTKHLKHNMKMCHQPALASRGECFVQAMATCLEGGAGALRTRYLVTAGGHGVVDKLTGDVLDTTRVDIANQIKTFFLCASDE
jgi:hypothetical protein